MPKKVLSVAILFAGALIAAGQEPRCQDKKDDVKKPAKVKVTLVVILASEEGNTIEKKLKEIAEEVRLKEPKLTSFRVKHMSMESLAPDQKHMFNLVEKKTATITIRHGADASNRVELAVVAPPDLGEIVYRSVCGKFLPIVTRYQTKNNERLILAISVQPCKGE